MTITYKNEDVLEPIRIQSVLEQQKLVGETLVTIPIITKILLKPHPTDPLKDRVGIISPYGELHFVRGPQIGIDPECKGLGLGWRR